MYSLMQDLRYGFRSLVKSRGFLVASVLTLSLGIGASTLMFTIVFGVLVRPVSLPEPERIFQFALNTSGQLRQTNFSMPQFQFLKQNCKWCKVVAAYSPAGINVIANGTAQRSAALYVSAGYFEVLGSRPSLGRVFASEEDAVQSSAVVLSHEFWKHHFGADPTVIGRVIDLNGKPSVVIGVMSSNIDTIQRVDLWTPLGAGIAGPHSAQNLQVVARLTENVTLPQARAAVGSLNEPFQTSQLETIAKDKTLAVYPFQQVLVKGVSVYLWVLVGAVTLVLLIACTNVASLLLVRGAMRRKEVALRIALGASRSRMIRYLFAESLILAALGGLGGIAVTRLCLGSILSFSSLELPRIDEIRIDGWSFLYVFLIGICSTVVFSVMPALQCRKLDLNTTLREGTGRSVGARGSGMIRRFFVIGEVALAFMLFVGAVLLVKTFINLSSVNPGFDPEALSSAEIWITGSHYRSSGELTRFYDLLDVQLKKSPGVQGVAAISGGQPLEAGGNVSAVLNGLELSDSVEYRVITQNYFETIGVSVPRGRDFDRTDTGTSQPVAIVNEAFVQELLLSREPLGSSIRVTLGDVPRTIVGVASNTKSSLDSPERPTVFVPAVQANFGLTQLFDAWFPTHILIRATDTHKSASYLAHEIRNLDPDLATGRTRPMRDVLSQALTLRRFMMVLVSIFAGLGLVLAGVGVFGTVSFTTTQRVREIGVRIALGAQPWTVLRLVLTEGLTLGIIGTMLGVLGTIALRHVFASLLFGVSASSPNTIVAVAVVLNILCLLACFGPAHRATRIDPLISLRSD